MTDYNDAKTLPDDTVLIAEPHSSGTLASSRTVVYIRNHPSKSAQWRATNGGFFSDYLISELLTRGLCRVILPEGAS